MAGKTAHIQIRAKKTVQKIKELKQDHQTCKFLDEVIERFSEKLKRIRYRKNALQNK